MILVGFCCAGVSESALAQTPDASRENLQQRVEQLESQMEAMRAELTKLKSALGGDANTTVVAEKKPVESTGAPSSSPQRKEQATEKHPTGIDLGPVRAVPYGTIYFNAFGNSGGTNNADDPLFATPTNQGNVSMSVRQTRLGLKLEGPSIMQAKSRGQIEADFFGGFPAIGVGDNFGIVRLRLAFVRLDWEKTSLEAGQDWMVFAPNNPVSIAAAAIPQMAAAGNPWARLPQIRVERRWVSGKVLWQGAVLAPSTGDSPAATTSPFFLQPTTGAASRVPFFQSRVAFNNGNWLGTKKSGSIGFSGQYGRARMANTTGNNQIESLGVAANWNFPIVARLTINGEAFFGRNLAGFQAGAFQGFNPDFAYRRGTTLISGGPRAIGTRGGWTQLGFTPPTLSDRLTIYGTYGIDDPRDSDLVSLTRDWRLRNQAYAFSFLYKFTPQLSWGIEFRRFDTFYLQSGKQAANHVNLGAAFSF
jgi:type II secretory pathway pseudopilin PulG